MMMQENITDKATVEYYFDMKVYSQLLMVFHYD